MFKFAIVLGVSRYEKVANLVHFAYIATVKCVALCAWIPTKTVLELMLCIFASLNANAQTTTREYMSVKERSLEAPMKSHLARCGDELISKSQRNDTRSIVIWVRPSSHSKIHNLNNYFISYRLPEAIYLRAF